MNAFHDIDLNHWNRLSKFRYYRQFENQLFNITLQANAEALYRFARQNRHSFFLITLFAILKALNQVPQMRQRITEDERVIEFEHVAALTPIMTPEEEFNMALTEYADCFHDFLLQAMPAVEEAKMGKFNPDTRKRNDYICASCVPSFAISLCSMGSTYSHTANRSLPAYKRSRFCVTAPCSVFSTGSTAAETSPRSKRSAAAKKLVQGTPCARGQSARAASDE